MQFACITYQNLFACLCKSIGYNSKVHFVLLYTEFWLFPKACLLNVNGPLVLVAKENCIYIYICVCMYVCVCVCLLFNCFPLLAYGLPLVAIANFQIAEICLFDVSCVFCWNVQSSRNNFVMLDLCNGPLLYDQKHLFDLQMVSITCQNLSACL